MGIVSPVELETSTAPFADAASAIWGPVGRVLIAAGAAISCLGALNGWVLLSGQLPRAAALDGLLPVRLARLNRYAAPVGSLVLSSAVVTVLIAMNYTRGLVQAFTFMILLATLATLVAYVFSSATALRVARRDSRAGNVRTAAGRMAVAAIAFVYSIWAVIGAGKDAIYWGFVLMIIGLPVYVMMRWKEPRLG
jgi:basic amino acid/polyamine antiporter, APA family